MTEADLLRAFLEGEPNSLTQAEIDLLGDAASSAQEGAAHEFIKYRWMLCYQRLQMMHEEMERWSKRLEYVDQFCLNNDIDTTDLISRIAHAIEKANTP